jgi:hypothetical protein
MTITNESKNNVTVSNEAKYAGQTWDDMTMTWDQAEGTWDEPGTTVLRETKNSITITNETKP